MARDERADAVRRMCASVAANLAALPAPASDVRFRVCVALEEARIGAYEAIGQKPPARPDVDRPVRLRRPAAIAVLPPGAKRFKRPCAGCGGPVDGYTPGCKKLRGEAQHAPPCARGGLARPLWASGHPARFVRTPHERRPVPIHPDRARAIVSAGLELDLAPGEYLALPLTGQGCRVHVTVGEKTVLPGPIHLQFDRGGDE